MRMLVVQVGFLLRFRQLLGLVFHEANGMTPRPKTY